MVKLTIFDINGREVYSLVEKEIQKGDYTFTWDAQNNPAGVYFCRFEAGEIGFIRKMVLVR